MVKRRRRHTAAKDLWAASEKLEEAERRLASVSTFEHRLKSTSLSDGGRPSLAVQSRSHPSSCKVSSPFRGRKIGTHFSDWGRERGIRIPGFTPD